MRKSQRLSRKEQFRYVFENGRRVDGDAVRILYYPAGRRTSRFAVIVSRKFGSSVLRNRAKRRARSIADRFQARIYPPCDILLFPRKSMITLPHCLIVHEFDRLLRKANLLEGIS